MKKRSQKRRSARLRPVHPGEILLEDFLKPMELSQYRLAKDVGVLPHRINEIVHGKRAVTAETALRLAKYFGTSVELWMGLQTDYDVEVARKKLGKRLQKEVSSYAA